MQFSFTKYLQHEPSLGADIHSAGQFRCNFLKQKSIAMFARSYTAFPHL
jgi:hypothetical protein